MWREFGLCNNVLIVERKIFTMMILQESILGTRACLSIEHPLRRSVQGSVMLLGKAAHPDLPGGKATNTQPSLVNGSSFIQSVILIEEPFSVLRLFLPFPPGRALAPSVCFNEKLIGMGRCRDAVLNSEQSVHECDATDVQ